MLGLIFIVLASSLLATYSIATLRNVNWYRFRPAGWLITEASSATVPVAAKAWWELDRRRKAGALGDRHVRELIAVSLAAQAATPIPPMLSEFLEFLVAMWTGDQLTDEQAKGFFKNMIHLDELRIRPRIVRGDPLPFILRYSVNISCGTLRYRLTGEAIAIDGKRLEHRFGSKGGCGATSSAFGVTIPVPSDQPEKGVLKIITRFQVYKEPDKLLHERVIERSAQFRIVPDLPANRVRLITPSASPEELAGAIVPEAMYLSSRGGYQELRAYLSYIQLPFAVAFNVTARVEGHEYPLGSVTAAKGQSGRWQLESKYEGPTAEHIDLVLRASSDVARQSVELFEIWGGELILEDISVLSQDPATDHSRLVQPRNVRDSDPR